MAGAGHNEPHWRLSPALRSHPATEPVRHQPGAIRQRSAPGRRARPDVLLFRHLAPLALRGHRTPGTRDARQCETIIVFSRAKYTDLNCFYGKMPAMFLFLLLERLMESTSNPQGTEIPVNSTKAQARRVDVRLRPLPVALFVIGLIILTVSAFFVHSHPRPYPIDLQTTDAIQSMTLAPVVVTGIDFVSAANDPMPSIIALGAWLVGLIIIGLLARLRGKSPVKWFESAIGIIAT